jgi:uncharacterized hydantoinase/oxoprolinase family protein
MQYLTYEEYQQLGGDVLDLAAFDRNIDRVCAMIDGRTNSRLQCFEEIPKIVKVVCADLVEYIAQNTVSKPTLQSKSQSADGVSESESYAVKTAEDYLSDIDRIIEPLGTVKTSNCISLLYRGATS